MPLLPVDGRRLCEIMTGNLRFLCFAIGTGQADPRRHKIPPRHRCLSAWGSRGGRLLRGRSRSKRIGFAVEWAFLVIALALTAILQPREAGLERDVVTSLLAFAMGNAKCARSPAWGAGSGD